MTSTCFAANGSTMRTISQLQRGETARIAGFNQSQNPYRSKLLAMGLTPGTALTLVRVAPFGDPIEIHVRGYDLSLRKSEASQLVLEDND